MDSSRKRVHEARIVALREIGRLIGYASGGTIGVEPAHRSNRYMSTEFKKMVDDEWEEIRRQLGARQDKLERKYSGG